ncbi:MAG TPA: PVC-type heme-binding CxxCH protein, partial [Verrucomicrobiae bacterium]|nr:PVC-type heme-binding CxxCH protein [Verrucomicrobiae bacterium]
MDHDLPLMVIADPNGTVRGVYFSYACHCVTLSNNKVSGDWAGFAKEAVRKEFPDAIALASVGCGADSNPASGVTGDRVSAAEDQGKQIAAEIKRLVAAGLKPIKSSPQTQYARIEIPFDTARTRTEWEERAKSSDYAIAYHAKLNLERLDRGEELPRAMTYPIATWVFGEELAMVFLPGETVVDYALRAKNEFDRQRLWVNGYANESRCYLPSERILREGGYEGGGAMVYYDRPQRFAPGLEAKIMATVAEQIPKSWVVAPGSEGIPPKSPEEALNSIRTHPGLTVELVAAEPLVQSPVAIDWGADQKLWVCEMFDYPAGIRGDYEPGGRVRFLEDTNHDGRYDKSTLFLDGLPFPTGVMAWGKGVFVCAAPDIIYAEDTDGDGKADKTQKLYSGFATDNFQARVNSLNLGLDNWIYGANGLITRVITTPSGPVDIRNHDFRFRPLNGAFEPVSGPTQQGLVRDDWGRWYGCANSDIMWYYPHEERYLRRNPNVPVPAAMIHPAADFDVNRVYPTSRLLERFNDPEAANRVTSGCGISVYRDRLLGEEYQDNTFTCEPVHNLVTRLVLREENGRVIRERAAEEKASEFLSSTDNWFRPVQTRTGPDGALYVVDMYRFVIEHPRWIPAARLAKLNVRAGADRGRIYRVFPEERPLRTVPNLATLNGSELAQELDSPNGTERDRVHAEILTRADPSVTGTLENLAANASKPEVRVQALCVLDGIGALKAELLRTALKDNNEIVRKHAVRLCETFMKSTAEGPARSLLSELLRSQNDPAPLVLHQLAYSLGEWDDPRAGELLGRLALAYPADAEMKIAVLSSATRHCGAIIDAAVARSRTNSLNGDWIALLAATAVASSDDDLIGKALMIAIPSRASKITATEL